MEAHLDSCLMPPHTCLTSRAFVPAPTTSAPIQSNLLELFCILLHPEAHLDPCVMLPHHSLVTCFTP